MLISALLLSVPGWATDDPPGTDNLYVDFAVPDLPALAALGLNPTKIGRPGNLKELSASVFPIIGDRQTIGPGVAIAWAPVYTFAKDVAGYRKPVLRRLAFSLVTSKEGKTDAVNAGAGLRIMLVDRSDPVLASGSGDCTTRKDDYECKVLRVLSSNDEPTRASQAFQQDIALPIMLKVAAMMTNDVNQQKLIAAELLAPWDLRKPPSPFVVSRQRNVFTALLRATATGHMLPIPDQTSVSSELDDLSERFLRQAVPVAQAISAQLAKIRDQFEESHWNATVASIDLGMVSQSATGSWSDLEAQKVGSSISAAFPAGRNGQIVAQVEARRGIGDGAERSHVGAGGRLLLGSSRKRFSAEAFFADAEDTDATKNGTSYRYTFGSEFRLTKGFWLELAFGTEHTPASDGTQLLSLANFKYAFKSSPRFTQIPGSVED